MKYLCLIYLADSDRDSLEDHGREGAAEPLYALQSAAAVRVRGGRISVGDALSVQTREPLGAACFIDARDLNDAIRIASKMPAARVGCIEVRLVREIGGSVTAGE